jgi:hypothetical protein
MVLGTAMPIDPFKPHDTLVKEFLGQPTDAAALLRTLLPPGIANAVDWTTLRTAPGDLAGENTPRTQTDSGCRSSAPRPAI